MKELLPAGLTFVSYSATNGSYSVLDSTWSLTSLFAPGDTATLTILFLVNANVLNGSVLNNTAYVRSDTYDTISSNDTATISTLVETLADISVQKTGTPDPVVAGEVITYTITITNAGPSDAQSLAISDLLPVQLLNGQFSLNGGLSCQPWVSPYNHGTLAAGGSITIQVKGIVNANLPGGTWISNTAVANSSTPDPDASNNSDNDSAVTLPHPVLNVCAGSIVNLGSAPQQGYSYTWSPAANLSNPNVANPMFYSTSAGTQLYTMTGANAGGCSISSAVTVNVYPPVSATVTTSDLSCFNAGDGSITITVTGGVPPYSYSIDNGLTYPYSGGSPFTISNLPAGEYKVRVRDSNGCVSTPCN